MIFGGDFRMAGTGFDGEIDECGWPRIRANGTLVGGVRLSGEFLRFIRNARSYTIRVPVRVRNKKNHLLKLLITGMNFNSYRLAIYEYKSTTTIL